MTDKEFITYIARLCNGEILSSEELKEIDEKAYEILDLVKNGEADFETRNALDYYVEYYDSEAYLDSEKTRILLGYHNMVEENNKIKLEREKASRQLRIKPINNDGVISAITIIETVVILGMIIAFLTLALLKN